MSAVYNPEAEVIAEIERLEMEARRFRKRLEQSRNAEDKRALSKMLKDAEESIKALRTRLP